MYVRISLAAILIITSCSFAQLLPTLGGYQSPVTTGYYSLDVPSDARSISMGESFVASKDPQTSYFYNPANLVFAQGADLSFSRRDADYNKYIDNTYYYSLTGHLTTPVGNFGLFYSRHLLQGDGLSIDDYTLGLLYAYSFTPELHAGITLKTMSENIPSTKSQPILCDIGALYTHQRVFNTEFQDELAFGVSLQNFGTDYRFNNNLIIPLTSKENVTLIGYNTDIIKLPRYLRTGFSYSFILPSHISDNIELFSLLLTGEYRNLLNPGAFQKNARDYWGMGIEMTFLGIISLRGGSFAQAVDGVYGDKGTMMARYGMGLSLPFWSMDSNLPLIATLDYGVVPLNPRYDTDPQVSMWSLSLRYTPDIF